MMMYIGLRQPLSQEEWVFYYVSSQLATIFYLTALSLDLYKWSILILATYKAETDIFE